jgi:hypothetical protein
MLADLTLLLHEVTDALRGARDRPPGCDASRAPHRAAPRTVLVTGTTSPGKARLMSALDRALAPAGIVVVSPGRTSATDLVLHVHAEADIDALLESGPGSEGAWARRADLLVPVDWEATPHSVRRVIAALIARGVDVHEAGV